MARLCFSRLVSGTVRAAVVWTACVAAAPVRGGEAVSSDMPEPPGARAALTDTALQLDGRFEEPCWQGATWYGGFVAVDAQSGTPAAAVQTRFAVVRSETSAYVGVECQEPRLDSLKAQTPWRDGAVWQDDCIEVFFDPSGSGRYYHQAMVNSRGTIFDMHAADFGLVKSRLWNGAFRAAGEVDAERGVWRVELCIPFGALVLGDDAGEKWLWNVARERHAGGNLELTSWSPLQRNFHQPLRFGSLSGMPADYRPFRLLVEEPDVVTSRSASGQATLTMSLGVRNETGVARRIRAEAHVLGKPEVGVKTAPTLLAAGAAFPFEFPSLALLERVPKTNIAFCLLEEPSGKLLKAVVKNLSCETRPVAVRMLRPCYRDAIYASQDVGSLSFRVELSPDVRQRTSTVRYALVAAGERQIAVGTCRTEEVGTERELPVVGLPVGTYQLQVSALGENGAEAATTSVPVRKLPPPDVGNEVRVDGNRNVLVNGKPFFGIGWYGSVPTRDPRRDVVALQNLQTPVVVIMPDVSGLRKAYEEHGIYGIVSVENGRLFHSFKLWQKQNAGLLPIRDELHTRTEPSDDLKRLVGQLVEAVRGEPGLLGYYIADEPEIHDVPSEYLENYYRFLRELDPYHPVFVTNDTIDGIVTHGYRCADVLSPDPYSSQWDYVPNFLKKINEVAGPGKATHVTLWHSSSQAHFTRPYGSAPAYSYRVFRNQYFASIAYGATGFTGYTSSFFLPEVEYRYGLPHVWRELRLLESAIVSPAPESAPTVTGASDLAIWARESGGHAYLVLVNHKSEARQARVSWPVLAGVSTLPVMSEGRSVAVVEGAFSDSFEPGDVHVYTTDPQALSLPTTQAIQAELEGRHETAVKPGNLLHWTHGTRVACSEGYFAPWFHQFYYYAVNGLTDDRGWSAYAWGGKPAWIELTLPRSQMVGKVVLHTPNIRDYTIDLVGSGGSRQRVEATGNTDTVVTHNLRPGVDCLKLRLTVTAVNTGEGEAGGAPLLSEIEAYVQPGPGDATALTRLGDNAPRPKALFTQEDAPEALWREDFTDFQSAPQYYWKGKDTKWVLDPAEFRAVPGAGGGITVACQALRGYSAMTHIYPYESGHRFFQVKLSGIEGKGYRFTHVGFGNSSGAKGYRGAVNTARPGTYTVDTHGIHDNFRTGKDKTCFIRVNCAGSAKEPGGGVVPGPEFTFDWLRLVRSPLDGLIVTGPEGEPLAESLAAGDRLHFELILSESAQDATVEVLVNHQYAPLAINGEPYVQLRRTDDSGCVWAADVALGAGTGRFEVKGYPALFRAVVTGGAIAETYASAFVSFR